MVFTCSDAREQDDLSFFPLVTILFRLIISGWAYDSIEFNIIIDIDWDLVSEGMLQQLQLGLVRGDDAYFEGRS